MKSPHHFDTVSERQTVSAQPALYPTGTMSPRERGYRLVTVELVWRQCGATVELLWSYHIDTIWIMQRLCEGGLEHGEGK